MRSLIFLAALLLFACNSETNTNEQVGAMGPADSTKEDNIVYPYTAGYSSKFEMGDAKFSKTVLDLWKHWDNNTLDSSIGMFADSVRMEFPDGSSVYGSRDTAMALAKMARGSYSSVKSTVDAWMSIKSTDKNQNWVSIWGTEVHTEKGKTDSIRLHEIWGFNKDGKAEFMRQYTSKIPKN